MVIFTLSYFSAKPFTTLKVREGTEILRMEHLRKNPVKSLTGFNQAEAQAHTNITSATFFLFLLSPFTVIH